VNFKQDIAKAFPVGFEHKTQTAEDTYNKDMLAPHSQLQASNFLR
jgi:hypothetical protein